MPFHETLRVALRSIRTNKIRAVLTMLGIIIGVASVIALSAVGNGATAMVTKQVESLGSNLLTISPGAGFQGGVNLGQGSVTTLTIDDVDAIQSQDPDVEAAAPIVNKNAQIVYGPNNDATQVQGTTSNYPQVKETDMSSGRFFSAQEVDRSANVACLGSQVAQTLFAGTGVNPVGQTIEINEIPFTVIGVMAPQGSNGFQNLDDRLTIPITTEMNVLSGSKVINSINVSAVSQDKMDQAQQEIEATLRVRHQLAPGQPDDFRILNQASILSAMQNITGILTNLLAGIAAISLIVGGIGIMNIMLVSVTERTREIGIRKAIGAKRRVILMQFLVEAVVLSVMGGLIGVLIGGGGSAVIGRVMGFGNVVSGKSVLFAVLFALLVGVIFGVYPARKASRLNPIDALRYE